MSVEKLERPGTLEERNALKSSFRRLLKAAGGQESAELITRARHQTLNRYGNVNEPDAFVPIDVLLDLERDVGSGGNPPIVLSVLVDQLGYQLVPKHRSAADAAHLAIHLGDVAKTMGELMSRTGAVVAAGSTIVSEADLAAIDAAATAVQTEVAELEADVEAAKTARDRPDDQDENLRLVPRSVRSTR